MSADFTTIKCPQCGNSDCKEISDGKFQCLSCNAVFFEKREKVEVHVKHTYNNAPPIQVTQRTKRKILLAAFLVPIGLMLLTTGLSVLKNKNPNRSVFAANVYDMVNLACYTVNSGGKPLFLVPVYRHGRDDGRECLVIKTFDPASKKLQSEVTVIPWMNDKDYSSKGYESFSGTYMDSVFYLLVAEKLFTVNTTSLTVKEKSAELVSGFAQLSSGIAKVEKLYTEKGFHIKANDGLSYYYFPKENKLYDEKTYTRLRSDPNPAAPAHTSYVFKDGATGTDEENRQHLFKVDKAEDVGGPHGNCGTCNEESSELTPGRIYFDGDVPVVDNDNIIVAFRAEVNDKTGKSVQCLDKSGHIKWTTPPVYFSVKQWKYPLTNVPEGFMMNDVVYLNNGNCTLAVNMQTGSILWQNDSAEDVFRESVK